MTLLPKEFSELEPFAATWCLPTERQRFAQRMASSMDEIQAFYDAFYPRAEEAIAYCERHGIAYRVLPEKQPARQIMAYSDNFAFTRRTPWTH